MLFGAACSKAKPPEEIPAPKETGGLSYRWPGPDPDYVRDLKPGATPVRLACYNHMIRYPESGSITEMVKSIRDAGYSSAGGHTSLGRRNPWLDATDSEITELREALETYDVAVFDVMIWANLIHPDPETRDVALKYAAENLEVAERIGSPMVTGVTGSCDPDYYIGAHPDNWSDETWDLTVRCIRQILDDTAGMKASLGVEAVVTTNIDSPAAHRRLMEDVGDPRCKVCLDPTNMLNLERFYRTGELLDDCFDMLGENILGCHGKDEIIERDRMLLHLTEAVPGDGIMDYETYLVRLSRMEWPRTLLLEHMKAEDYPRAKAFVEQKAAQVGITIHS